MTTKPNLKTVESILFILTIMVNNIILNLPKQIIDQSGTGAVVNVLYIGAIAVIFTYLLSKLFKKFEGWNILDVSKFLGGNFLNVIIGILFIIIFLFSILYGIIQFSFLLKIIYFPTSPLFYIVLFFLAGIYFANKFGSKPIIKTTLIIVPISLISLIVLFTSVSEYFVFERLSPILGFDTNRVFLSGLSNIFAFNGLVLLYFIGPFLEKKTDFKKVSLTATIISWIFLILSVIALLVLFPFISYTKDLNSFYIISRLVEYGDFFQRTDAIFILVWIISLLLYFSICSLIILEIFKKIANTKDERGMNLFFLNILLGFSILFNNYQSLQSINDIFYKYVVSGLIFIVCPIILVLANIKSKVQNKMSISQEKS